LSNYREKLCLSTGKYNNIYIDYCCVSSEPRFHSHAARQPRSHSHVFLRELVTSRLASVDIPYLEVNGIKRLFFFVFAHLLHNLSRSPTPSLSLSSSFFFGALGDFFVFLFVYKNMEAPAVEAVWRSAPLAMAPETSAVVVLDATLTS